MEPAGLIVVVLLIVGVVALIMWSKQKEEIGTIQCKRCHHVGAAKGLFVPFRGIKPVCQQCQSEDWVKVDSQPKRPTSLEATTVAISIVCPSCSAALKSNNRALGRTLNCPRCRKAITVVAVPVEAASPVVTPRGSDKVEQEKVVGDHQELQWWLANLREQWLAIAVALFLAVIVAGLTIHHFMTHPLTPEQIRSRFEDGLRHTFPHQDPWKVTKWKTEKQPKYSDQPIEEWYTVVVQRVGGRFEFTIWWWSHNTRMVLSTDLDRRTKNYVVEFDKDGTLLAKGSNDGHDNLSGTEQANLDMINTTARKLFAAMQYATHP